MSNNGLGTVISAFFNSSLKYSFFSLYFNSTNGHHYCTSVSARTKHAFEKETLVQWYFSVHRFLIAEKMLPSIHSHRTAMGCHHSVWFFKSQKSMTPPQQQNQPPCPNPKNKHTEIKISGKLSSIPTFNFQHRILCTGNQWIKGHQIKLKCFFSKLSAT